LLGKNGHQHFDRITKTKTVENLLTTMDATNIKSYLEYLAHTFTKSNADDTTSREWALNQMSLLITSAKIPKEESWVTDLVKFLMTFAFFEVKTSEKKSTYLSGTHIPSPALTFPNIKHCQDRFQDVLVALSKLPPSEKVKDNAVLKSRKLNGFTNAGELWAYQVYEIYKGLQKNKKLVSLVTPSEKAVTATKKAMAIVADLRAKIAKMDKAIVNDSVERGFEILFLNLVLHSLINESEGVSVLMELTDCYEKTFAKKTKAKKGKKGAKKQEEEEEEEQLDPIDVIVDILVSFLTNESPVLKSLAEQVFEIFSHKLTKQSLEMLLNILGSGDGKQGDDDLLQGAGEEDEEEDEEEDDIEMVDMSDVEEVDDEEENGDVDEELRRKIAEAMQSEGIDANDESDEEIDDAAMAAFDEKLAEVFQQKKNLKEEKKDFQRNVVHFKNNVMELIVIYARKNPTNPLVLELIVPLLQVIRDTPAKSVSNQFSTKVISFLKNKLAKATDYPHATDDYVFEILQAVHDFAKHSTSKDLSDMCNQLSLYLRKCIVGGADFEVDAKTPKETKAALAKMLAIYSSSIKLYMSKKNTHFHASIIQSLLQRYPLSSWGLLETLIVYLNRNECCNVYRLGMACQWTSVIIQRTVGKVKKKKKKNALRRLFNIDINPPFYLLEI
jgi:DNA polymerase phi